MPSLARSMPLAIIAAMAVSATTLVPRAAALVVVATDGENHSIAPPDDPGWINVADRGVYLGNRWMLTAGHVGPGATTFSNGGSFAFEIGTNVPLVNPMGLEHGADLIMYRLTTDPNLPTLSISAATPAVGAKVTLIGYGLGIDSGANETHWTRTQVPPPPPPPHYIYTEVDQDSGEFHGYKSTSGGKRWGTNVVEDDELLGQESDADHTIPVDSFPENDSYGETVSFFTGFDKLQYTLVNATDSEAQALSGDSGCGVFLKVNGAWTLVGITHSIDLEYDQPGGTGTAFYGNHTFIADLAFYRDQILAISAVPELGSLALVGAAIAIAAGGLTIRRSRRFRGDLGRRA